MLRTATEAHLYTRELKVIVLYQPFQNRTIPRKSLTPSPLNERSVGFASLPRQPLVPLHRATALCGCHYASLHSGFVWLTASILAWSRGGSPSKIAPFPGKGAWGFGKDAEIERPKALQDAKPTKRSYRDREQALFLKKHTFFTS